MKKLVLMLGAVLMCSSAFGYTAGHQSCTEFEDIEREYIEQLNSPDPYVSVSLVYGMCLLIKGSATNNEQDVSNGLHILHGLKDKPNSAVPANYFLAKYHLSGGTFNGTADYNLELAAHYFSHTLAIIKTYNFYPPLIYSSWEAEDNIEMDSYNKLPIAYLEMFYYGVLGDYNLRLLNSPSYTGDQDLKTYPDYRRGTMGYIDLAIEHAGNCSKLPLKRHFERPVSPYLIKICGMYEEKAKLLKDIQRRTNALFAQERCQDIGSDEVKQAHCPEIIELDKEFMDTLNSIDEEGKKIIHPVRQYFGSLN